MFVDEKLAEGAAPVPLSATVCGDPGAPYATLNDALKLPAIVGEKLTEMLQLPPGVTMDPQLFVWLNAVAVAPPVIEIVNPFKSSDPVFFSITTCAPAEFPIVVAEKFSDAGFNDTIGPPGVVPLPLKAMLCGELDALSVTIRLAV